MAQTVTVHCPGCNEEIEVEIEQDYQGDGAWGMAVTFGGISEKACFCVLSQAQEDELMRDADDALRDYYAEF